jgi:hypothetical protein
MSEEYNPEIDDSLVCTKDDSGKYRSIIDFYKWIIILGRFDTVNATSDMSRFNMLPREGKLKDVKRVLSYLKAFPKGRVVIDTSYLNNSVYSVEGDSNWVSVPQQLT